MVSCMWDVSSAKYCCESRLVLSNSLLPHRLYSPWNSPGQNTGVGSLSLLQGIFPTQGSNPGVPHCRWILYQLSHKESPRILEWVAYPFSSRSSQSRNRTGIPCIVSEFFTNWTIRETQWLTNPENAYISLNPAHISSSSTFTEVFPTWSTPGDLTLFWTFMKSTEKIGDLTHPSLPTILYFFVYSSLFTFLSLPLNIYTRFIFIIQHFQ